MENLCEYPDCRLVSGDAAAFAAAREGERISHASPSRTKRMNEPGPFFKSNDTTASAPAGKMARWRKPSARRSTAPRMFVGIT